jgi:hypothetical protein
MAEFEGSDLLPRPVFVRIKTRSSSLGTIFGNRATESTPNTRLAGRLALAANSEQRTAPVEIEVEDEHEHEDDWVPANGEP